MSEITYSISTDNSINAKSLLTIASMITYDDAWDDEVHDAVFHVLDVFKRHVEYEGWIGEVRGIDIWKGAGKTLRELADMVDSQVAKREAGTAIGAVEEIEYAMCVDDLRKGDMAIVTPDALTLGDKVMAAVHKAYE